MAHRREDAGRRRAAVLECRRVGRHRPAVGVGERFLELRHRRPGDADRHLAVDVDQRELAHRPGIGEVRGARSLDGGRFGSVAAPLVAVTIGALLAVDLGPARRRRHPGRQRDNGAARAARDAVGDGLGDAVHRIGGGGGGEQREEPREPRVGRGASGPRQERDIEARLLDELAGLVHFFRRRHPPRGAPPRYAHAVFLGGERHGGDDAPRRRQRIRSLPREWRGHADDERQTEEELTTNESDSQRRRREY